MPPNDIGCFMCYRIETIGLFVMSIIGVFSQDSRIRKVEFV